MRVPNGTTGICQECRSDCDCMLGMFCSSGPQTRGKCLSYAAAAGQEGGVGYSCVAMTDAELLNPTIPRAWKCAKFYTEAGRTQIDWRGFCSEFTCYPCDSGEKPAVATLPSPLSPVCPQNFNGPRRVCTQPGYWVYAEMLNWNPSVYLNNVSGIWLAIIWTTLVVMGGIITYFTIADHCGGKRRE